MSVAAQESVDQSTAFDAVVVGAGFAGLYMLHKLRALGMRVRVYEAGADVGGAWYWNRYPGCRCDAESVEYSYSFSEELQQEWQWTERFAPQAEIQGYIRHVTERFDLRRDIRFDTRVKSATYDEASNRWAVETHRGDRVSARFFIMATGCLTIPRVPEFPGLSSFKGAWYHTTDWPKEKVDFSGKRVGIIGTGSTGVQAIPVIAKEAAHLHVFQRTPGFVVPARNAPLAPEVVQRIKAEYPKIRSLARVQGLGLHPRPTDAAMDISAEARLKRYEALWEQGGPQFMYAFKDTLTSKESNQTAVDFLHGKIRQIVKDPETAEALCPKTYPVGAKRICVGTDYFETYNRDNVTLVDVGKSPIIEITSKGILTQDGEVELDAIVFATGFDAMTGAMLDVDIRGRGGRPMADKWSAGPLNYLGIAISEYPNLFMLTGPGSPSVFSNVVMSIEQHVEWLSGCLKFMQDQNYNRVEVKTDAEHEWVRHVNETAAKTLIPQGNSWYVGANIPGKPRVFMPYVGGVGTFRQKCDEIAAQGYVGFSFASV